MCYDNNTVLVRENLDGTFDLPTFQELETKNADNNNTPTCLFSMDGRAFYLPNKFESPQGFTWKTVRETMNSGPRHSTVKDKKLRSLSCTSYKQVEFPKIAPAPFDAVVQVLEGEAEIRIGDTPLTVKAGETVIMPSGVPHALRATERFKMLLTMIRG